MIKSGLNSFPRPKYTSAAPAGANSIILMHFDGTNGSTTFTDVYGVVAPTATGTAAISTTQSVFGGASLHTPSGTNYISGIATSTKLAIAAGDFTLECRAFLEATPTSSQNLVGIQSTNATGAITMGVNSSSQLFAYVQKAGGSGVTYPSTGTISNSTFHALAIVRKSAVIYLFIDGTLDSSAAETIGNIGSLSGLKFWAGPQAGGAGASGNGSYIDEFRMSNAGLYTATYVPASSAFAA